MGGEHMKVPPATRTYPLLREALMQAARRRKGMRPLEVSGLQPLRVADGRLAEVVGFVNTSGMMVIFHCYRSSTSWRLTLMTTSLGGSALSRSSEGLGRRQQPELPGAERLRPAGGGPVRRSLCQPWRDARLHRSQPGGVHPGRGGGRPLQVAGACPDRRA